MASVLVKSVLSDPVLVSRESARLLEAAIRAQVAQQPSPGILVVDFEGVAGVAPSFLDELISTIESLLHEQNGRGFQLIIANPPTRLSSKFEAIARGHGMSIRLLDDQSWAMCTTR